MRSRWATLPAPGAGAAAEVEVEVEVEAAAAAAESLRLVVVVVEMGKGSTLARRHMSASPRAQCMASQARQGTPSSVAMGFQSSGLSLRGGVLAGFCVHMVEGGGEGRGFVFPVVEVGEERRIIPIVDSRQLVALLLVPVSALLEVVLVVQSAADGAAAGYLEADVVPFHAAAAEDDDFGILGGRPLASALVRGA